MLARRLFLEGDRGERMSVGVGTVVGLGPQAIRKRPSIRARDTFCRSGL